MELFANNAASTLNMSILSTDLTLDVVSATGFPTTGNFRILVDTAGNQELMLVTAVSGVTFTVTRGIESTTAVAHSGGVAVTQIVTAGALAAFRADSIDADTFANIPPAGVKGRLFYPTDGPIGFIDDGSAWRPLLERMKLGTQPPAASNFTQVGATSATLTDVSGTLELSGATTTNEIYEFNTSVGATFQADMTFDAVWGSNDSGHESCFGFAIRNASDGKFYRYSLIYSTTGLFLQVQYFTSLSGASTVVAAGVDETVRFGFRGVYTLRVVQGPTNITFSFSINGFRFYTFYQEAVNLLTTPDHVGLFFNDNDNKASSFNIYSLKIA